MKRAPTDEPNLDDILARDFAELKVGEEQIAVETPEEEGQAVAEADTETEVKPIVYNQKINAHEDRDSFSVAAPSSISSAKNRDDDATSTPPPPVLKAPTSQLGDDFDVEW